MASQNDLNRILAAAISIKQKSASRLDLLSTSSSCLRVDIGVADRDLEFDISPAPSILQSLVDEGVPPLVAQRLSERLKSTLASLHEALVSTFRETWLKILDTPRHDALTPLSQLRGHLQRAYQSIYDTKASEWASEVKQMALFRFAPNGRQLSLPAADSQKFNYNYVPILETFFAEEQFPSRADKVFLAKKAGMTYRQIHVWFQNRRSRTRKSSVKTYVSTQASCSGCDSSEDTDVDDSYVKPEFSSRASSFTIVADGHPLEGSSPPHAFPGKYPPDFDEKTDPFPCRFGDFSSFPKMNWDRNRSVLPIRRDDAVVDIDELSEAFGKLRIRSTPISKRAEVDYPRAWGSYNPRPLSGCDVMAAYTTRPFSAPIPSFIRYPQQKRDLRPCTMFRPQHRDLLQTRPNASSLHNLDTPFNHKSAFKTKRVNKPRLPKRVPTNQPKLFATYKSSSEPLGLANTDEADTCTRGMTLTLPLECVAPVTRSSSSSSDESLPSLTPSASSSSSSEAQSPSSPTQGLPDESALCFLPELSAISMPDASQGLLADIPFSLFTSSDFNYDLLSSKSFVDNAYDIAFSQSQTDPFQSLQLQPPPVMPQPLPFSFDFAPITS